MKFRDILKRITVVVTAAVVGLSVPMTVLAADPPDYEAESEARKALPIQSNAIVDWPQGPEVSAEAAILIEAKTGAILYAKNIDERLFPASTTKILTCTLAIENCDLKEDVVFSYDAVHSVPWDGSKIGMDAGESITMQQALEAILVGSANEVSNGVAEHVAGSMDAFVEMMNKRVEELGLKNTHFTNANGLFDEEHYTSAYDLAIIAKDFFSYEILCKLSRIPKVEFTATPTQPDTFSVNSKNLLLEGKKYEYEYLVGSKTGYTDKARQTLVSCAKKEGMELICVVMKEESPLQFTDTIALFEYGFNNFTMESIKGKEFSFDSNKSDFFKTGTDIFGDSTDILKLNDNSKIILPNNATFDDLTMKVVYDTENDNAVAKAEYSFNGNVVGYADIMLNSQKTTLFDNNGQTGSSEEVPYVSNKDGKSIFVNIKIILISLVVFVAVVSIALIVYRKIILAKREIKKKAKNNSREKERRYDSSKHHNFKV
ncbi:MAG: D-alanyl-D-alanine carboxypeptidase [Lachnospiraceae bacterium]|nr:D-alanyl-D-alanine carboxypeptidase [Lachnospiraceae bacterium]